MAILGLDIGGANIKGVDEQGRAISCPFAIWKHPERLKDELTSIFREFPLTDRIALTMTAELADCFETKSHGVRFILDAVETTIRQSRTNSSVAHEPTGYLGQSNVMVWATDGRFVDPMTARENTAKVAAANWHALATWCGQLVPKGSGVLVDIGSTTTDIIPLSQGKPIPMGLTDVTRLQTGELSYSGVRRTPLCAVAHSVPFGEGYTPLAAEHFATTLDLYVLLNEITENEHDCETANGKPATKKEAHDRIVRMLCADRDEIGFNDAVQIARFLADVQRQRLAGSLERILHRLPAPCQTVILSGSGIFLARQLISENRKTKDAKIISLAERLSPAIAEAACAHAVTQLARMTN